jgi:hypothetical protein
MKTLPTPADNLDDLPPESLRHPTFGEAFRFWLKLGGAVRVALVWTILWSAPVILLTFWLGSNHTVVQEGIFFSKAALVTFGGAYAVLPYVAQEAVQTHRWLSAGQMLDGLGLAETTPGPLIMVTQFVGFLAGWNHPGLLPPIAAATLGALVTTWTTFTPCFLSPRSRVQALTVTLTHPRPKSAPWLQSQMLWQFEFEDEFDDFLDLAPQADGQREQNCR